jgi:hypothetical protein
MCPTENSHHTPTTLKRHVPSSTFKKECDDDDAAARSGLWVSLGTRKDKGGWLHPTPFWKEGWRTRASARRCRPDRQRFLLTLATPPQALHRFPPTSPPTNACHHVFINIIAILPRNEPRPSGPRRISKLRSSEIVARREGTVLAVPVRTCRQGANQALLAWPSIDPPRPCS